MRYPTLRSAPWPRRLGMASAVLVLAAGGLTAVAQNTVSRHTPRTMLPRTPGFKLQAQTRLTPQTLAAQANKIGSLRLTGTYLVFEYDPARTRRIDVDGNGSTEDTGDRVIFEGKIWASNRNGAKLFHTGQFASMFDYLDPAGARSGTDLTQATDMVFFNSGQVRAGGFWNVADGVGAPTLAVLGATGRNTIRRYRTGQFVFVGELTEGEELYFLAR